MCWVFSLRHEPKSLRCRVVEHCLPQHFKWNLELVSVCISRDLLFIRKNPRFKSQTGHLWGWNWRARQLKCVVWCCVVSTVGAVSLCSPVWDAERTVGITNLWGPILRSVLYQFRCVSISVEWCCINCLLRLFTVHMHFLLSVLLSLTYYFNLRFI
jgi:hypothetical protein